MRISCWNNMHSADITLSNSVSDERLSDERDRVSKSAGNLGPLNATILYGTATQ